MKSNANGHLSEDTLRRYLTKRNELPEDELLAIEEHLGVCKGTCVNKVRRRRTAIFHPSPRQVTEAKHLSLPIELCASILAHLRQARAAIVVNFQEGEDLLSPLPGFPVKGVLAMAAGYEAIEIEEPGLVDFDTASVPPGTMVRALFKETITVVVPCVDPFGQTTPRVELLLEEGEIRSVEPKQEQRNIREIAGKPESLQSRLCWVACFENVPTGPMILTVAPGQQLPRG